MADAASAEAPGRVNLMGEHTDYHDGYVLPTVIPQRTSVYIVRRRDSTVRASSAAMPDGVLEYEIGREAPGRGWLDYLQGVTCELRRRGVAVPGFDVRVASTIPVGAGVSSSAALEVSLLRALRALLDLDLDDLTLAQVAQAVETDFVGAPVGIMDQMASSLGRMGEALFIDTRSLAARPVPLPPSIEVGAIDSGVPHSHAGGRYASRRQESFEAAALLGVARLRDVGGSEIARIDSLPQPLARRARHVVTENQRVLETVEALRADDGPRLGRLFAASHASMRDDYETSTPDIDSLVALADAHPDVFGARLTGGGFGGAVVLIAKAGTARAASESIRAAYERQTGRSGSVLLPAPADVQNPPGTFLGISPA